MGEHIGSWANLTGYVICIRRNGRLIRVGQVEVAASSGDMLWLRSEGVEQRTLFQKAEGYTAWTLPEPVETTSIDHVHYEQALGSLNSPQCC